MAVYLVRHAEAIPRHGYDQPDLERPLSPLGTEQADALVELFTGHDVGRVLTSRAVRCWRTVQPLAHARDLDAEPDDRLTEGSSIENVLGLVVDSRDADVVLCSHGDIIPDVLRLLALRGVSFDRPPSTCAKGSTWLLELDDEVTGTARYWPPPGD
ncbi:MAG: phosphoglycerate mutase family protein [Actinomycetota bacterium]